MTSLEFDSRVPEKNALRYINVDPLAKTKNVLWVYILQKHHKVFSVKA